MKAPPESLKELNLRSVSEWLSAGIDPDVELESNDGLELGKSNDRHAWEQAALDSADLGGGEANRGADGR
ncbi:MAG TPA: hypothetical protein VFW20_10955 [Candidatus Limnocylindrales bacterium]|nr:hypothetical protein [Candidatus Limnocylindrales bacterium]